MFDYLGLLVFTGSLSVVLPQTCPGPKLAALSKWYEFYYDVYLKGQYVFKIDELHKQYGPIIRITPDELHVSDPDFYVEFFTRSGPQSKYDWIANRFNNEHSTFAAIPPDLHKLRRSALDSMFSRQQIRQLLPLLQEKVAKLMLLLKRYEKDQRPCRIDRAMWALSEDMIFEYGFGICRDALDKPDFKDPLHEVFVAAGSVGALALQFPVIPKMINSLPDWVVLKLQPDIMPLINMRRSFELEIASLMSAESTKSRSTKTHRTVFVDLYNNPDLPPSEKTPQRFLDEAQLVIGAGLSTTGWAATVAIYHILANAQVLRRLREELFSVIPKGNKKADCTDLDWVALEALPYFQACIRETLRLSYGMSARNARRTHKQIVYTESPYMSSTPSDEKADVNGSSKPSATPGRSWIIPAYTPVSMSIPITNHNEHIFPDSRTFNPDRWLGPEKVPEKYFVTFGKGSRMCLGMQLAWAELSLMLAGLFRWYELELYETEEKAVRMAYDATIPIPEGTNGLRVKIKKELD